MSEHKLSGVWLQLMEQLDSQITSRPDRVLLAPNVMRQLQQEMGIVTGGITGSITIESPYGDRITIAEDGYLDPDAIAIYAGQECLDALSFKTTPPD